MMVLEGEDRNEHPRVVGVVLWSTWRTYPSRNYCEVGVLVLAFRWRTWCTSKFLFGVFDNLFRWDRVENDVVRQFDYVVVVIICF